MKLFKKIRKANRLHQTRRAHNDRSRLAASMPGETGALAGLRLGMLVN